VFARLQYKINFDINNTSSFLLATDLLRDSSKRRLFKIVATHVEKVFLELLNNGGSLTSIQARSIFFFHYSPVYTRIFIWLLWLPS